MRKPAGSALSRFSMIASAEYLWDKWISRIASFCTKIYLSQLLPLDSRPRSTLELGMPITMLPDRGAYTPSTHVALRQKPAAGLRNAGLQSRTPFSRQMTKQDCTHSLTCCIQAADLMCSHRVYLTKRRGITSNLWAFTAISEMCICPKFCTEPDQSQRPSTYADSAIDLFPYSMQHTQRLGTVCCRTEILKGSSKALHPTLAWCSETSLSRKVASMMSSLAASASSKPGDENTSADVSPVKATSGVTTGYVTSCRHSQC